MQLVGPDHVVIVTPDPETLVAWYVETLGVEPLRLEEWRRGEVLFASLRVSDTFIIDLLQGERSGTNVDHLAIECTDVDLDELAASGTVEVEAGPADLFGAQGIGRGLYLLDPDGNRVELRTYPR